MKAKRWQDWVNLLLGIWLFISPWVVGYVANDPGASRNAWILGVAIVIFSGIAVSTPQIWEEVINILLGIWMIISTWVVGFTTRAAETNAVIVGILLIIFAIWAMIIDRDWRRQGTTTAP